MCVCVCVCVRVQVCVCVRVFVCVCVDFGTLLVILEDRPVTFNNKLPSSHLKCLQLSRYVGPAQYQVQRTDEALN